MLHIILKVNVKMMINDLVVNSGNGSSLQYVTATATLSCGAA